MIGGLSNIKPGHTVTRRDSKIQETVSKFSDIQGPFQTFAARRRQSHDKKIFLFEKQCEAIFRTRIFAVRSGLGHDLREKVTDWFPHMPLLSVPAISSFDLSIGFYQDYKHSGRIVRNEIIRK